MRSVAALMFCAGFAAAGAQAPGVPRDTLWTAGERAARAGVINAVLDFRPDLRGDSVKVASCRLAGAVQDTAVATWVAPAYRHLLVAPLRPVGEGRGLGCSVMAFQQPGARVLWLQDLVEVRRRSSPLLSAGVSYEVTIQWLRGADYRRYERYVLRPRSRLELRDWRVVEYEFAGEEWTESFGGAGRRP